MQCFGENGLIRKAEQAKELQEQTTAKEQNELDAYSEYVDKEMNVWIKKVNSI